MNYCLNGNFGYKGLTALIAPNRKNKKSYYNEKNYKL